MARLMKSLCGTDGGSPMAPPPPGWDSKDHIESKPSNVNASEIEPSSRQHPSSMSTHPQPESNLSPIHEHLHINSQSDVVINNSLQFQLSTTMLDTLELPSQVQGQAIDYGTLDGVSLERLMLGAAITAVPGVQTASVVYSTITSGAGKFSRSVRRATHLSKSFRGVRVGCTDENLSSGWVEVSSQEVRGTE